MDARSAYCRWCLDVINRWAHWATEWHGKTGRWLKVAIDFGPKGATVKLDASGGRPGQEFVMNPQPMLPAADAVHIRVPQNGPNGLAVQSMADIAFYLRLKATPGCVSKLDHSMAMMHLYIEPGSKAAELFVSRMMKWRGLPAAEMASREMLERAARMMPLPGEAQQDDAASE